MTRNTNTATALRNAALAILRLRGQFHVSHETGVATFDYAEDSLRICHQPAIAGSANPSMLDIWHLGSPKPVLTVYRFAVPAARLETITLRAGAWQAKLLDLAVALAGHEADKEAPQGVPTRP